MNDLECQACGFTDRALQFDSFGMDDVCPSCGSHSVERADQ